MSCGGIFVSIKLIPGVMRNFRSTCLIVSDVSIWDKFSLLLRSWSLFSVVASGPNRDSNGSVVNGVPVAWLKCCRFLTMIALTISSCCVSVWEAKTRMARHAGNLLDFRGFFAVNSGVFRHKNYLWTSQLLTEHKLLLNALNSNSRDGKEHRAHRAKN